jgi:hypothetical protein
MTERERTPTNDPVENNLMTNPAEKQTYVDPAEPKATTAFPSIAIVVAILAIIIVVVAIMLLTRFN